MNTTDTTTTQIDQLRHVTAAVTALVKNATPDQLLHDSPCAGWSGRDVLHHMVGGADWFAEPARGEAVPFPNWSAMPRLARHGPRPLLPRRGRPGDRRLRRAWRPRRQHRDAVG